MKTIDFGTLCICLFASIYVGLYLWQQSGDKVFVFFAEPFHNVDQTLQSRLRERAIKTGRYDQTGQ